MGPRRETETTEQPDSTTLEPDQTAMQRITWLGALCNLGLAFLKGFLGTLTHSSALIADAAHSLSDLVTDAITLITLKLVGKPADEHHPYGYMRYEHMVGPAGK